MSKRKDSKLILILISLTLIISLISAIGIFNLYGVTGGVEGKVIADTGDSEIQQPTEISADDDPFLGPEDSDIVVIEFSDFECPYCGAAANVHQGLINKFKSQDPNWEAAVPKLKEFAEEGKIKFVYRDFPLSGHPHAQKAAEAAECADEQNKFWEMHDIIFANQLALSVDDLKGYAATIGLNTAKFNKCLDSGQMADEVRKDLNDGASYGVDGTPAFFVNGIKVFGAQPWSVFEQLIEQELNK